jgi:peroxiredoxin
VQLGQLQKIEDELLNLGYKILAISPDRPEKLRESVEKNELKYVLLSDAKMEAAKAFGLAFRVDAAGYQRLSGFGIDLEDASGEKHHLLPVPAVFLIGKDGIIQFQYANPNYKVRLTPEVLLAAAKTDVARVAR